MNTKSSSKLTTAVGATAAAIVLSFAVSLFLFTPAASVWGVLWAEMRSPKVELEKRFAQQQAAFKATWEGKCAQTPSGRIGYPLASNFKHFYLPKGLDLDFQEGSGAFYDIDDIKTVDCPRNRPA
jgi:hypothetical protein